VPDIELREGGREMSGETNKLSTWIDLSIENGGTLTVMEKCPGQFDAAMSWLGEETITGCLDATVQGALNNLESALLNDAGDEMIRKGAV
jgi:hypothetical protein